MSRSYGWQHPKARHRMLAASRTLGGPFGLTPQDKGFDVPTVADCFDYMPPVYDQGEVGDCTANAGIAMHRAVRKRYGMPDIDFSRLYLYARTRKEVMGLDLDEDSGATITDMVMALERYGACSEGTWSSADPGERFNLDPTPEADAEAKKHEALPTRTYALSTVEWAQASIGLGFPVVLGFDVPEHFETDTAETGQLRVPEPGERFVGGHAVTAYGVDAKHDNGDGTIGALVIRNSWGGGFGLRNVVWNGRKRPGDFLMPLYYPRSLLALDLWAEHQQTL